MEATGRIKWGWWDCVCLGFLGRLCEFPTGRNYFSLKKLSLVDNAVFHQMNFSGSPECDLRGQNCCHHCDSQNKSNGGGYSKGKRDQNSRWVLRICLCHRSQQVLLTEKKPCNVTKDGKQTFNLRDQHCRGFLLVWNWTEKREASKTSLFSFFINKLLFS